MRGLQPPVLRVGPNERLGDERARQLVAKRLDAMSSSVADHSVGTVRSLGDGSLACFDGPGAVSAALEPP